MITILTQPKSVGILLNNGYQSRVLLYKELNCSFIQ